MQYPGFKQIINKPGHTEEVMKVEETKTTTWWFRENEICEKNFTMINYASHINDSNLSIEIIRLCRSVVNYFIIPANTATLYQSAN